MQFVIKNIEPVVGIGSQTNLGVLQWINSYVFIDDLIVDSDLLEPNTTDLGILFDDILDT